jgi:RND family efflux transporter MFP subunit
MPSAHQGRSRLFASCASIAVLFLASCERPEAIFAPPPPPEVTVANPIVRTVEETLEFSGRTRGFEEVELRARVKGFLASKATEGGNRVRAGDVLFTIDPREYQAAVDQANAKLSSAKAQLTIAELTLERAKEAMALSAATQQEVDQKQAMRDSAKADVSLAQALLDKAMLDLEFTKIKAQIDGRIGIVTVDVGQLVGASDATLLATVINDSKVYVDFEIDERTVLEMRRRHSNRRPGEDGRPTLPLRLQLAGESGFPHEGVYDRGDNAVDTQTGTIGVSGIFDNGQGEILPGLFVRIQAIFGERETTLVPDVAVLTDQLGKFVFVVGTDGTVERRGVEVGRTVDGSREIRAGLTAADRVVVNGTQRVRSGGKANAKLAQSAG